MKIAVMGAGAIGGLFGARLAQAGCEVGFVERGAHLAAMRSDGLMIESAARGDVHLPAVQVTDDPATLGPVDAVLIGVKLRDTEAAAQAVKPLIGPDTMVLSLQNGVTKDDILRRVLGDAAVVGTAAYVASQIARPGVIRQTGPLQRMVFGEYDGRRSERTQKLLDCLLRAGIEAQISSDIRRALWEKFVFLTALSSTTATTRVRLGPILAHPRTRAFFLDLMRETVAVGRACGVALPEDYAQVQLAFADTLPREMTSSLYHDLEAGRPLEVAWLAGAVVQLGEKHGVPAPLCRAVWDILVLHADGAAAP